MIYNLDKHQPSGAAASINGATKSYKKGVPVLNQLNLTVPIGSIYGLLGSSGCGKTTLLSCILGQLKLDSGEIRIFGDIPSGCLSGVPGKNVGYMPQEISLYTSFIIKETVSFFGRLNGMNKDKIENEYEFLTSVLDLPDDNRKVETLSGGQQRRVSLAVALLHSPKLLILDEPTVGLDPLMRKRIWLYLNALTQQRRTTVIVTTHYIEECREADCIGIMSAGRLLAEQAPTDLLRQYQVNNLETIVLLLMKEAAKPDVLSSNNSNLVDESASDNNDNEIKNVSFNSNSNLVGITGDNKQDLFSSKRVMTLIGKNVTVFYRNLWYLTFVVALPALLIYIVCISYGSTPNNLGLGIINLEFSNHSVCLSKNSSSGECSIDMLSCHYIWHIPQSTFRMKWMDNETQALKATQAGDIWGYIKFSANFSNSLVDRIMFSGNVSEMFWNSSQIKISLDETNAQVSIAIKYMLYKAYEDFLVTVLTNCEMDTRVGESSLKFGSPVYGTDDVDLRPFFIPGMAVALIFFYPIMTTSIRLIGDKKSGVLPRSLVSGVQTIEIILADIITEFPVLLCQILLTYGIMAVVLGIKILGSPILLITIFLLSGYAGVSAGFLLATLCKEEFQATIIANAGFVPSLLISGILWPLEGMSVWLVHFAPLWPCTFSAEAIRSIVCRGWELMHPNVWPGVLIPSLYILFFSFLNFILRRRFGY